jgi:hypothetical protein
MENKWKKLSISDKLNVISEVKGHANSPHTEMANHFGLLPSVLSKIMLSKEKFIDAELKCGSEVKK